MDLEQSASHYERVLGFHREYIGGTPPQFAILSRDGLAIMLRLVPTPEQISPNEKQGGTWDAFFWVRDAQGLHAELRANGADIVYGPIVQEAYHMREFAVRDREGYVLGFGQQLKVTAEQMAGYRKLPMGKHDREAMTSPRVLEAFDTFVKRERELLALLQGRLSQDEEMLSAIAAAVGTSTSAKH